MHGRPSGGSAASRDARRPSALVERPDLCDVGPVIRPPTARRETLRLAPQAASAVASILAGEEQHDWFLTASQRGNPATRLRPWTEGNTVEPLVHGACYFPELAAALGDAGAGDLVLLAGWRGDPDERLDVGRLTIGEALTAAARRGARVAGLLWRSHHNALRFSARPNRALARRVNAAGGEVLLDQRVRRLGSHHQKFVVVRHPERPADDVAFVGGIDVAHARRDDATHHGDPQELPFSHRYGPRPAWHDVQVRLRGPGVRDVEEVFRERWADPAALTRLPWQTVLDLVRGVVRSPRPLPPPLPDPPAPGTCAVQLLRTYPKRVPGYPFAPDGERSTARGYAKALRRARRLVYIEDQYLWSTGVARVFADALRREPELHLVAVVPRFPDDESPLVLPPSLLGHSHALDLVREAGGDRVLVLDLENHRGEPVYVHSKICVVDDVWATVGSDNFNRRSWTHDSELTAAVVDAERDLREPRDPAGLGDGARVFARELRLELCREHTETDDDTLLLDPAAAVATLRARAEALDAWYAAGRQGPRPPGRVRIHRSLEVRPWERAIASPVYRAFLDPDGRPRRLRWSVEH